MTTSPEDQLAAAVEELVDAASLHGVLAAAAATAFAKAEHLESNWGDSASAKVWARVGSKIERIASAAADAGI